eukprot:CAMPEP_0172620844 /NCGR_PEP_ID=MMETSP1068-20121228/106771_1 /TAXON_ID=35684 /ORGANISM="Pseudopedinella elastica, Strain CCMP716" /LENGTH=67 /DNA_ID=CAMNT_0013428287 /DNA_START=226 /DNA_END=429 /DNA_ORIENTATION=+
MSRRMTRVGAAWKGQESFVQGRREDRAAPVAEPPWPVLLGPILHLRPNKERKRRTRDEALFQAGHSS